MWTCFQHLVTVRRQHEDEKPTGKVWQQERKETGQVTSRRGWTVTKPPPSAVPAKETFLGLWLNHYCLSCFVVIGETSYRIQMGFCFSFFLNLGCVDLKKKSTTWELWVKFYLGQNEDCSPGDGIPDSSGKLLRGGGEKVRIYVILVKGVYMQLSIYFLQKVSPSYEEQSSPWRILVLF